MSILKIYNKIHDVKRGGGGGGPTLSVTMTLIFPKIVWTCPLRDLTIGKGGSTPRTLIPVFASPPYL